MNTQVSYCKKALVVLMAVMMVFTMIPSMAWADGGTGTSAEEEYAPIIKTQPAPESENIEYSEFGGAFLEVEAEATGDGELSYHWYRISTPEDEELSDDYAMDSMCLAPINILGKNQFYCVVTNTVNGKEYSVKSNVVTIFVYKSYIAKLNLYKDEEKIINGQGYWQGKEFNMTLEDSGTYKLEVLPINKDMIGKYSMTVSYNGETSEVTAFQSDLTIDTSKFEGRVTGWFSVQVGEYDTSSKTYVSSELYKFNVTRAGSYPTIKTQPQSATAEYDLIESQFLEVEAEATDGGELSYKWYRVGEAEDTELGDEDGAMENMFLAPKNILGTSKYYCVVTNTVDGKAYSIKSDVAEITIYKAYLNALTVVADDQIVVSNQGNWKGGTFDIKLSDRDDYELRPIARDVMGTASYSMTTSYNGESSERSTFSSSFAFDVSKFPYGSAGYFTIEVGEYDTTKKAYSSSELYRLNITKFPGLKSLAVSENSKTIPLDTDLCAAGSIMKYTQTKTTQAAAGNEVKISALPIQSTTEVYIGNSTKAATTAIVNTGDYPVIYEKSIPYAAVPVKLVAANGTAQIYTVMVQITESHVKINSQPTDITCYDGDTVTLNVVAEVLDGGTLSYQWYKVGTAGYELISGADGVNYTPVTNTVGETSYYCIVTSTKDGKSYTVKSDIAMVTVKDSSNLTPVIVSQTDDRVYCNQGDEITLSVEAMNPPKGKLSYQWYQRGIKTIPVATTKDYKPSTEFNGTQSYYCVITNTVGENTYTATSKTMMVRTALTQKIHAATVTNQPGSYIFDKNQGVVEGAYNPVSKGNSKPAPFYVRFTHADYDIEASLSLYHATTNSYDDAELVDDAIISGNRQGYNETGYYMDYKIDPNTAYPTGEHYFYVVITLSPSDKDSKVASVSTKSDILKIDFVERTTSLEGKGTQGNPYLIKTDADLTEIQQFVAEGDSFAGAYFKIVNDITLPANWSPIGTNESAFSGNIDGKIDDNKNATITVPAGGLPLLGYIKNAYVKNLNIYGEQIEGAGLVNNYTGVGLDGNAITIENVCLKSGSKTLKSGLVASSNGNGYAHASAGFVVTIHNCTIEENVVVGYKGDESQIGSIAGRINGTIESCTSAATVKGVSYVGGILGTRDNALSQCVVKNCTFSGSVEASGNYAGGIVGGGYDNQTAPNGASPTIVACTVTGNVKGNEAVGGIFGGDGYVAQTWDNVVGSISANRFSGKVSGNKYVGALIGYRNSLNRYDTIENNFYTKGCGTENAIGFVKYLDTSYKNPTTPEGTIVFSTESGTKDCPTVEGCAWKAKHNRTDDPLGKDMEKLAKMVDSLPTEAICYELVLKEENVKTEYYLGEDFSFGNAKFTAKWTDGSETEVAAKDITVSGYNKNSHSIQTVTLTYGYGQLTVQVAVKQKESGDVKKDTLTVSFTLLGDSVHDEADQKGGPHGLAMGGLSTWMSGSYEVKINSTVWDLMQQIQRDNSKVKFLARDSQYGTYVEGVTYDRTTLREFDNGNLSGWMYTLNGRHPEVGVAAQFLSDRDAVVFHYTDDYTKEEGSEKWNTPGGVVEEVKDVTTDTKTGTTTAPTDVKVSEKTNADGTKTKVAEVKVSADNQKEILKQAKEKKSNEIILVVSSKAVGDATKADVTLDKSFIDSIVKDTNAKLTIKTPFGDKTYTQDELKAMSEAATGSTVTVAIEKAAEEPADDAAAKMKKAKSIVKDMKLVARSSKTAKKNVKAVLKNDAKTKESIQELKDLGFTVKYRFYRSTKKASFYKSTVTKKVASYTNTSGKKGTKYFYKVQVRVYDENGKLIAKTALKQCKYATRTWSKAK